MSERTIVELFRECGNAAEVYDAIVSRPSVVDDEEQAKIDLCDLMAVIEAASNAKSLCTTKTPLHNRDGLVAVVTFAFFGGLIAERLMQAPRFARLTEEIQRRQP